MAKSAPKKDTQQPVAQMSESARRAHREQYAQRRLSQRYLDRMSREQRRMPINRTPLMSVAAAKALAAKATAERFAQLPQQVQS